MPQLEHSDLPPGSPQALQAVEQDLQNVIVALRAEEATLQEEIRQLRAAVQIYNEVVARLAKQKRRTHSRARAA